MQRIVYTTFLVISLIALSIILYKNLGKKTCEELIFTVPASSIAGQNVQFSDETPKASKWEWDFGDSTDYSMLQSPTHAYEKPGKYLVKLTVNGTCVDYKDIDVAPRPVAELEMAMIQGVKEAKVGQSVKFTELTENATAWEWLFSESGKVDSKEKSPNYTFQTAGYKTVTVYVTSPKGRLTGTFNVNVKEKDAIVAVEAPVQVETKPKYTTQEKKNIIINKFTEFVTNKDDMIRTSAMDKFTPFICGADVPVYKNKKDAVGILVFCKDLMNRNKICNIKQLTIDWNDGSDCLKAIHLDYKEK